MSVTFFGRGVNFDDWCRFTKLLNFSVGAERLLNTCLYKINFINRLNLYFRFISCYEIPIYFEILLNFGNQNFNNFQDPLFRIVYLKFWAFRKWDRCCWASWHPMWSHLVFYGSLCSANTYQRTLSWRRSQNSIASKGIRIPI